MLRRTRLRPVSKKRLALAAKYAAFRLGILSRDEYACRYCGTKRGTLDIHHVLKPRAKYLMDPKACVTLCRGCHERVTAPYRTGRLVIVPIPGGFRYEVIYAKDKFAVSSGLLLPQWE